MGELDRARRRREHEPRLPARLVGGWPRHGRRRPAPRREPHPFRDRRRPRHLHQRRLLRRAPSKSGRGSEARRRQETQQTGPPSRPSTPVTARLPLALTLTKTPPPPRLNFFFFNNPAPPEISPLPHPDALPI